MTAWSKYIIMDKTVKRIRVHNETIVHSSATSPTAFEGYDENGKPKWTNDGKYVKLYDLVAEAVEAAIKIRDIEGLPVDVLHYTIIPEQRSVTIDTVKF